MGDEEKGRWREEREVCFERRNRNSRAGISRIELNQNKNSKYEIVKKWKTYDERSYPTTQKLLWLESETLDWIDCRSTNRTNELRRRMRRPRWCGWGVGGHVWQQTDRTLSHVNNQTRFFCVSYRLIPKSKHPQSLTNSVLPIYYEHTIDLFRKHCSIFQGVWKMVSNPWSRTIHVEQKNGF